MHQWSFISRSAVEAFSPKCKLEESRPHSCVVAWPSRWEPAAARRHRQQEWNCHRHIHTIPWPSQTTLTRPNEGLAGPAMRHCMCVGLDTDRSPIYHHAPVVVVFLNTSVHPSDTQTLLCQERCSLPGFPSPEILHVASTARDAFGLERRLQTVSYTSCLDGTLA